MGRMCISAAGENTNRADVRRELSQKDLGTMRTIDDDLDAPWETATVTRSPEARLFTKRAIVRTMLRDRGKSDLQLLAERLDREVARQLVIYAAQKTREGR